MKLDFSAHTLFQEYLQGQARAADLLAHPAYQVIQAHAAQFDGGLSAGDVDAALAGRPSPFYGLRSLEQNLAQIARLVETLRQREAEWLDLARAALLRFLPGEDLSSITIYPLIGYDMGIGLRETVCMNLNHLPYLRQPEEFLFYLIHECTHVIYERGHEVAKLEAVQSPREWQDYFALFLQNEGFAVYAPWDLRRARGGLADAD